MKSIVHLALPALALAAAMPLEARQAPDVGIVEAHSIRNVPAGCPQTNPYCPRARSIIATAISPRQQAPDVRIVEGHSISTGPGSGCPPGNFSFQVSTDRTIGTAIFDNYRVTVGPNVDASLRESFCDFVVTFTFPVGCTTAVIHNSPGGLIRLQDRFEASFAAQYSIKKGQIMRPPDEICYNSTNYGAPPNEFKDFKSDHAAGVRVTVNTATERNVVYRASTRIFLSQPGINPTENSVYDVDNSDIYITDLATC